MKVLRFHRLARLEISRAYRRYSRLDDPSLAPDFQSRLEGAFQQIQENPDRFPHWRSSQIRRYVLRRFPYVIIFVNYHDFIRILAVAHTSRREGYWKSRMAVD